MISDLYLQPPTLGEFCWICATVEGNPLEAFDKITGIDSLSNIFWNKFLFTLTKIYSESEFEEILNSMVYTDKFLPSKISNLLIDWVHYLSPDFTYVRKAGECKALSVFSVAYRRRMGIPTRFALQTPNHMIYEEFDGNKWVAKEPQELSSFTCSMYDPFYNQMLSAIYPDIPKISELTKEIFEETYLKVLERYS